MWVYAQRTGELTHSGAKVGVGYSGKGVGKNNPDAQKIGFVGPIPVGRYTIQRPVDTKTHGPYVLWLTEFSTNEMWNRDDFGIHGDSIVAPGTASEGCIILPYAIRVAIWESGDHVLEVIQQ